MTDKVKLSLIALYISFIVPLVTTFLLSEIYYITIRDKRYFYPYEHNWIIIAISILLILSTYVLSRKKPYEIIYYVIGIIICFISKVIRIEVVSDLLQTFILQCVLFTGYAVMIIILLLSSKYKIVIGITKK